MSLPFLDPTIPNIFECGFDFAKIFYRKIGLRAAYQLVEPERRRLHSTQDFIRHEKSLSKNLIQLDNRALQKTANKKQGLIF